jgi:hypothetical protein
MVTTTDSSGTKIDITNKKEMELAILESNKTKFTQSSHTPFYLPPLKDDFGFKGLTSKQPQQVCMSPTMILTTGCWRL